MSERADRIGVDDNIVAAFQIENRPVRGRIARLGSTLDLIVGSHGYPAPVARMVAEAAILAVLVGDTLKFEGRLIVQANGDGPVRFVVAEWVSGAGVRAMAQLDPDAVIPADASLTGMLGKGSFAMTIDPGEGKDRYQGVVALEGETLSDCAEAYFAQSEQVPTMIRIAAGEILSGDAPSQWRGSGAIVQAIAPDDTRGGVEDDWDHVRALFGTIAPDELIDPTISAGDLLFRLFHEDGVRMFPHTDVPRHCPCTPEKLLGVLASFDAEEMGEDDPVSMTCQYCNRTFAFALDDVRAVRDRG
ncbi:MAG: molecular chaperone Hsp33 [Maricaulis sp.]|jgi:molecular chaperone Hsp33|nr:molecular chaperone Hsp33 [Maricaulis sp.]HAQ34434.1 molecular chaperone Hsp33 [Alphaproteobacteria bacterium]